MGWNEVDNKLKKAVDRQFVSCEEKYEKSVIKRVIKEEFPKLHDSVIDEVIESCCREVKPPRPRKVYLECLINKLRRFTEDVV